MLPIRNCSKYTSMEQEADMEDEDSKKRRKMEERGVIRESFPNNALCFVFSYITLCVRVLRTVSL